MVLLQKAGGAQCCALPQGIGRVVGCIRQFGAQGDMPGYFAHPRGLAVDSQDHLYVVDAQFEAVQVFGPDGALLLAFGEEGRNRGQFWLPAGI